MSLAQLKRGRRKPMPLTGTVAAFDTDGAQDGPIHPGYLGLAITPKGLQIIKVPGFLRVHGRPVWGSDEAVAMIRQAMREHPGREVVCATGIPHPGIEGRMPGQRDGHRKVSIPDFPGIPDIAPHPSVASATISPAGGTAHAPATEESKVGALHGGAESSEHQKPRGLKRGFALPGRTRK
jgi:hypothetical protein